MKRISLIKFQADCSTVLESVQQTNETVLITKQGKPLVNYSNKSGSRSKFFGATGKQD
jgi:PHD/YefM family antitoxin component YafN of YafNO toxin-antitoxin module